MARQDARHGPLTSTAAPRGRRSSAARTARTGRVVLDVRWRLGGPPGRADYEAGHIPGAVFVDLDAELAAPPGAGGRHPLARAASAARGAARGPASTTRSTVVAYDDGDGSAAARGCGGRCVGPGMAAERVSVLDGGFRAWVAEDRPVDAESTGAPAGDGDRAARVMPVLDADRRRGSSPATAVLLDARSPAAVSAARPSRSIPCAGHIPGARNAARRSSTSARTGAGAPRRELAARFAAAGVRAESASARTAARASTAAPSCSRWSTPACAGRTPAALYVGSWRNWVHRSRRPVAAGSAADDHAVGPVSSRRAAHDVADMARAWSSGPRSSSPTTWGPSARPGAGRPDRSRWHRGSGVLRLPGCQPGGRRPTTSCSRVHTRRRTCTR